MRRLQGVSSGWWWLTLLSLCTHNLVCAELFDNDWRFYRGDSEPRPEVSIPSPVLLTTPGCVELYEDTDINPHEAGLGNIAADNVSACCIACASAEWRAKGCVFFTLSRGQCWFKSSNTTMVAAAGKTSGRVAAPPAPTPMPPTPWPAPTPVPAPAPCTFAFCLPTYNDSAWTSVEVPHDWSIQDLPARRADTTLPLLSPRYGEWRFRAGDDASLSWASPALNDSVAPWQTLAGGRDWRAPPLSLTVPNATGWYRRWIDVPPLPQPAVPHGAMPAAWTLNLGVVAGADECYVNGTLVGRTGSLGKLEPADYITWRAYPLPPNASEAGRLLIALRVWSQGGPRNATALDGAYPGGLYDDPKLFSQSFVPGSMSSNTSLWDVRNGAFDGASAAAAVAHRDINTGPAATGYTVGGTGWYRKTFDVASPLANGLVQTVTRLRFDGVYHNSTFWLNGQLLGHHPYGYTPMTFDVSALLRTSRNVLAVRVQNIGDNSRWYSGSGIYRHVHLVTTPATYIEDVWVSTTNVVLAADVNAGYRDAAPNRLAWSTMVAPRALSATVRVVVTVRNAANISVCPLPVDVTIVPVPPHRHATANANRGASSQPVIAHKISSLCLTSRSVGTLNISIDLSQPHLWSPDTPYLYKVLVLLNGTASLSPPSATLGEESDKASQTFGVRAIGFNATHGLTLNGVPNFKLYGGCVHQNHGPLGAASVDGAEWRKVARLKALGFNAVRTAHNPPANAFLDACDALGVLVVTEFADTWAQGKNSQDYHLWFEDWHAYDLRQMVLQARSRASVIMYSIGNEIPSRWTVDGKALARELTASVHALDGWPASGRAVTSAIPDGPYMHDLDDFDAPLDVVGYNYGSNASWTRDHARLPGRVMVDTESHAIDAFGNWAGVGGVWDSPWVLGEFIWTAQDYIGEVDIGHESDSKDVDEEASAKPFPFHLSFCGDLDLIGDPKPQSLYRQVLWGVSDLEIVVHVPDGGVERRGHWGWPELRSHWTWGSSTSIGHGVAARMHAQAPLLLNVSVYVRSHPRVSLFVNDEFIGEAEASTATQYTAVFSSVPYQAGNLTAIASGGSRDDIVTKTLLTAGVPSALRLITDTQRLCAQDRSALAYVSVQVVDAFGVAVPDARVKVHFAVMGGGVEVVAVGSGDPQDTSSFYGSYRVTWRGRAVALLRPLRPTTHQLPTNVTVMAQADGLPTASIAIELA